MEELKGFSFDLFKKFVTIGFIKYESQVSVGVGFQWSEIFVEFYIELVFFSLCINIYKDIE